MDPAALDSAFLEFLNREIAHPALDAVMVCVTVLAPVALVGLPWRTRGVRRGALFAAVFIRRFPRRPVYLGAGVLTLTGHSLIACVGLGWLPAWVSAPAVACSQFGYTAGYNSVPGLLTGELLPANLR